MLVISKQVHKITHPDLIHLVGMEKNGLKFEELKEKLSDKDGKLKNTGIAKNSSRIIKF